MSYFTKIDEYQDILDVRDLIEAYEEAQEAIASEASGEGDENDFAEIGQLLEELRGNGGDHQWNGVWYPVTLVRDSYFVEYAQELADDLYGAEMEAASWPFSYIDWERAARDLRIDYTSVEYNGVTYWYR